MQSMVVAWWTNGSFEVEDAMWLEHHELIRRLGRLVGSIRQPLPVKMLMWPIQ
jgi:hypothetical protein